MLRLWRRYCYFDKAVLIPNVAAAIGKLYLLEVKSAAISAPKYHFVGRLNCGRLVPKQKLL
jgi:hypothetical protein